jgi:hypothetical protein
MYELQCLTLAPVIKLKASIASDADKEALAGVLLYLGIPSTGSTEGDVVRVAEEVERYPFRRIRLPIPIHVLYSLVKRLGLHTTLKECRVPEKDFDIIASAAKHIPQDEPHVDKVQEMLTKI